MINKKYMDKLCSIMMEKEIDALMMGPSTDLKFLLGYSPLPDERFQSFVLLKENDFFYISPQLTAEEIEEKIDSELKMYTWGDHEGFVGKTVKALKEHNLESKTIGINNGILGINFIDIKNNFDGNFINGHKVLEELRIIKDKNEISLMRKAAELADIVIERTIEFIKPGVTEKDIKEKIEEYFLEEGADGLSFTPIVASGKNNSKPHYAEDSRVIQEKDIIILDLGCKYKGLCSDMSRTVFVGGVTEEERKVYEIIRESNEAGEKAAQIGVTSEEVDNAAREVIKKAGYGDYFINRTGHGIGYSVHEAPDIVGGSKVKLKPGMAFSIEPGIYIPNKFGMRIEDIVVMTEDGPEILNKFSKEIIIK
jgi:Xaa-Pro aminopeptidase